MHLLSRGEEKSENQTEDKGMLALRQNVTYSPDKESESEDEDEENALLLNYNPDEESTSDEYSNIDYVRGTSYSIKGIM